MVLVVVELVDVVLELDVLDELEVLLVVVVAGSMVNSIVPELSEHPQSAIPNVSRSGVAPRSSNTL
jgi:hypothetical protein